MQILQNSFNKMKDEIKDYFKGIFFDLIIFYFVYSLIKKQNEILKFD